MLVIILLLEKKVAIITDSTVCEFLSLCSDKFQNQNFTVNGKW